MAVLALAFLGMVAAVGAALSPASAPYAYSPYPSPYYPSPGCSCPSGNEPTTSAFYEVRKATPPLPSLPTFSASVSFFANNDHDHDDETYVPAPPQVVNLTLDSSCNQIILPRDDCFRLRLQDTCEERSISCNASVTCGLTGGTHVFPTQTGLVLPQLFNNGQPNGVPVLCSSGVMPGQGIGGIAPYKLSLVVQMHSSLAALNLPKAFGYCLGNPNGYFFIGKPHYTFVDRPAPAELTYIPTLRWEEDSLPVLELTGIAIHAGDQFNVMAPLSPSVFTSGLAIGTSHRYMSLVEPAYQWLRGTMMNLANSSPAQPAPSPFAGLDLCFTLEPYMNIAEGGPKLELRFPGDKSWMLTALSFLVVHEQTVCFGVLNAGPHGISSLGTLQQEEFVVEYNFQEQTFGVSDYLPPTKTSCSKLNFHD